MHAATSFAELYSVQLQVQRVHKGFGRRTISQLQVIKSRRLVLSLSDDGVNLHTLPDLQLKGQADR